MDDTKIDLLIKAAQQSNPDYPISCSPEWTVLDVKNHIFRCYPGNPNLESQRIIYSGRLLQDHLKVKDFIRKNPDTPVHIVHLVCSITDNQPVEHKIPTSSKPKKVEIPTAPSEVNATSYTNSANNLFSDPNFIAHQYSMYHQLYTQYLAQYPNFVLPAQLAPTIAPPSVVQAPDIPRTQQNANGANGDDNNNNEVRQNENVRVDAAGGADNDEDAAGNRDWLDWSYSLIRFLVMSGILYYYSSFKRVLVIFIVIAIIYVFQNYRKKQSESRNDAQPANQNPENNENANESTNENVDEPDSSTNDAVNFENTQNQNENVQDNSQNISHPTVNETNNISFHFKVWLFLKSLIFSLIPDPQAIQN